MSLRRRQKINTTLFEQPDRQAPCAARLGLARARRPDLAAQDVAHVAAAAALDGREELDASGRCVERNEHMSLLAGSTSRRGSRCGSRWRWAAGSALADGDGQRGRHCHRHAWLAEHVRVLAATTLAAHFVVLAGWRERVTALTSAPHARSTVSTKARHCSSSRRSSSILNDAPRTAGQSPANLVECTDPRERAPVRHDRCRRRRGGRIRVER
jgi:hypothetical protein